MAFDPKAYRQQNAERLSGGAAAAPVVPQPKPQQSAAGALFKPFQEAGILTVDPEKKAQQGFWRRVGEDALTLGLAPSALLATGFDLLTKPKETLTNIGDGFVEGFANMANGKEWVEHPLLNLVNTVGNISIVGGVVRSTALNGARTAALDSARIAAIDAGVDATIAGTVFAGRKTLRASVDEGAKLGSTAPVASSLQPLFKRAGFDEATAATMAQRVADESFGSWMTANKTNLGRIDAITKPVSAFGSAAGKISAPVREMIFGTPEISAVGKLYGSEVVKQDMPGFGMVEEWSGMQATERGLPNTVENRTRIIQEWTDNNPEYAALTPLERVKHFREYAEADLTRKEFAESKGRDYVLTKALPTSYVEAMTDFVQRVRKGVDSDGSPMTNAKIIEELERIYGRDFGLHKAEVSKRIAGKLDSTDRAPLITAIEALANDRIPVTMRKLTKAEEQLVDKLGGSGYRIGRAPTGKPVSQAAGVTGEKYTPEQLAANRTVIGRIVDRLGLSPEGVVEGTQIFMFREAFTQNVLQKFGAGSTIMIDGARIPVESLAIRLEKARQLLQNTKKPIVPGVHTIADLRVKDLKAIGMSEKDAVALDAIIRQSNRVSPSVVGIGEWMSNQLRTGNNPLSRSYDGFLKWQSYLRFRANPMFGFQAAVESVVWGNLWAKTIPGQQTIAKALSRIPGLQKPLARSISEPTMAQESMVVNEVMGNYNRQLRDAGMAPEIYRTNTDVPAGDPMTWSAADRLRFEAQNRDSNLWLGMANFSTVRLSTNMMKSYAGRYGLSLEEALNFKMVNGTKVYDHPWLVDNMKTAAQAIFGYKPGVLTSPMIRTLNTVFFPIRFQTKAIMQTADWFGSLSPVTRLAVLNSWTSTAHWLQTKEGKEWRNKNRPMFANLFNYTFAYEGIGKSVDAVTRGSLFGGNTGLIGGLPFGFIANIARDLGYVGQDSQINTATGMPFQREVIKDEASFPAFVSVVENIILSMTPAMPFYSATGGQVTVSFNRGVRTFIQQVMSSVAGANPWDDKDYKDFQAEIRKEKKKVAPGFEKLPFGL